MNVLNVSRQLLCAVVVIRVLFLVPLIGGDSSFFKSRTWTDTTGREIVAEYVSATKYHVKIRRDSDGRVFTVPVTTLSKKDQEYVELRLSIENVEKPGEGSQRGTDPFAPNQRPRLGWNVQHADSVPSIPLGKGIAPERSKIPSLGFIELGQGYPGGPSNLVNILVWPGDTIAPESMPRSRRESSIERIAEDMGDYFSDDSNTFAQLIQGMSKYSERKLKGFLVETRRHILAPSMEEISELMDSWYGVVALYGFYESDSSGELHRVGGRYTTLVDVDGRKIRQNLMGSHYAVQLGDELVGSSRFEGGLHRKLEMYAREGFLEVKDPLLVPGRLFPAGRLVLLEQVVAFELLKLPDAEK